MAHVARLRNYFERVYVISLPHRNDRRTRLQNHLEEIGLASPDEIDWVRAISGDACPPPAYFLAGGGAWGCLQSHVRVVQDAIMDGLSNYLVLEDDVIFHADAPAHLARLMEELPDDWDQLYLGGQHLSPPESISGKPFLFLCTNVNRTHAFALNRKVFKHFQQHITHAPDYISNGAWHVDHQLGIAHQRRLWRAYAPTWWLAGQDECVSNIKGGSTPRYWWHYEGFSGGLPFFHFPPQSEHSLLLQKHFHFGNNLKSNTLEDIGLDSCLDSRANLIAWLRMIAREAMDHWKLPALSHPLISVEDISGVWTAGVLDGGDMDQAMIIGAYPRNGLFPHALNSGQDKLDLRCLQLA